MAKFIFGNNKIHLEKGTLSEKDYMIYRNNVRFTDEFLFESLNTQISTEELAYSLIKYCISYDKIQLEDNAILTKQSPLDANDVYNYCTAINLKSEIQEPLFIWILRCDIDNINFPPPVYNGGVRIFTQVLLLLAYKFQWKEYYLKSIVPPKNLPRFIYLIGHPNNTYSQSKSTFQEIYSKFFKNTTR